MVGWLARGHHMLSRGVMWGWVNEWMNWLHNFWINGWERERERENKSVEHVCHECMWLSNLSQSLSLCLAPNL